jgi:hypothetical protein
MWLDFGGADEAVLGLCLASARLCNQSPGIGSVLTIVAAVQYRDELYI